MIARTAALTLGLVLVSVPGGVAAWPWSQPSVEANFDRPASGWDPAKPIIMAKTRNAVGLWLGCSIRDSATGRIVADLKPVQVPESGAQIWELDRDDTSFEYVVTLWKGIKKDPAAPWGVLLVEKVATTGWKRMRTEF